MEYDVRRVLHFVAIAQTGSFSGAAQALSISQPALSRSIRLLEGQVGGNLLERGRHGARPTDLGKALLAHGLRIRASLAKAKAQIGDMRKGLRGHIAIGATPLVVAAFLPAALRRFLSGRDDVGVEIIEDLTPNLLRRLRSEEIDFFLGPTDLGTSADDIDCRYLFEDHLVLVARRKHPLAKRGTLGTTDLAAAQWVLPGRTGSLRGRVQQVLAAGGLTQLRVRAETDSIRTVIALLASGDEIALFPFEMFRQELSAGQLVELDAPLKSLARPIGVHLPRFDSPPVLVELMVGSFEQYARQHYRGDSRDVSR